jgi:hypothetical protein
MVGFYAQTVRVGGAVTSQKTKQIIKKMGFSHMMYYDTSYGVNCELKKEREILKWKY